MGSRRQGVDPKQTIAARSVVPGPSLVLSGSGSTPVFARVAGRGAPSCVTVFRRTVRGESDGDLDATDNARIYLPRAGGESLGRVGHADHKAEPREGAQAAAPSCRRLHPDDPSPGSEARSASRCRRRACRYSPSGLGGVSKSSSRANISVPYSRPAVRLLKRAVAAVESDDAAAARTATQRPERGRLSHSPIYIVRRPLDVAAV